MASFPDLTLNAFESRFKDREYVGSGGFAKVYKAFDHAQNRFVALKVADVRPEFKQFTLRREVELVNALPFHPNIARYDACYRFDMGVAGEIDFAILKFYEDGNLEQFLYREDLTAEDYRIIIRGILMGVAFLHQNNYVHRDLKAQNILLQREDGVWMPKITDFGLSRKTSADYTGSNSSIGFSYAYAAPEQIQNKRISKKVDLWAVGVIIYRIITGELPFKIEGVSENSVRSQIELTRKIINLELPDKLYSLAEPYQSMIKSCLVLEPDDRVDSAEWLIAMLDGRTEGNIVVNDHQVNDRHEDAVPMPYNIEETAPISTTPDGGTDGPISNHETNLGGDPTVLITKESPTVTPSAPVPQPYSHIPDYSPSSDYTIPNSTAPPPPVTAGEFVPVVASNRNIQDNKPSATIPPPNHQERVPRVGTGRSVLPWILISILGLMILIGSVWGISRLISNDGVQHESVGLIPLEFIPVLTWEQVYDQQNEAIVAGDREKIESMTESWDDLEQEIEDFRMPLARAINATALDSYDVAINYLHEAVNQAINDKHTGELKKHLEAESHLLKLSQAMPKEWKKIHTALEKRDSSYL